MIVRIIHTGRGYLAKFAHFLFDSTSLCRNSGQENLTIFVAK